MAFLQTNFYSKTLRRLVSFNALVPIDEVSEQTDAPKGSMKALYLLHGYHGNYTEWVCRTRIQELSLKHNIAVFMPSGENHFYLDDVDKGELFGEFIGNELVEFTRKLFPITNKREDTFIGGLSMGGYGAIRNGLKYAHNFSRILALSSALIINNIAGKQVGFEDGFTNYNYYKRVFGDLDQLLGSDKDPEALIMNLKKKNEDIPKIYMACGTEDFLLNENREYRDFLLSENIDFTYQEGPGIHDWNFWDEYIEKAILWTLA